MAADAAPVGQDAQGDAEGEGEEADRLHGGGLVEGSLEVRASRARPRRCIDCEFRRDRYAAPAVADQWYFTSSSCHVGSKPRATTTKPCFS